MGRRDAPRPWARTRANIQRRLQPQLWRPHKLYYRYSSRYEAQLDNTSTNLLYHFRRMALARGKIVKANNEEPDEIEKQISQALLDLEVNSDLKAQLRELHITAAKEVDCSGGKKAIVIFVPVPQLKQFQKIQTRLVRELEKKFSGKHVVFIAQRRILAKPTRKA